MSTRYFRTDHCFQDPASTERQGVLRTFDVAESESHSRAMGKASAVMVAKRLWPTTNYLFGFTVKVPGVTSDRPMEVLEDGRFRKFRPAAGDA